MEHWFDRLAKSAATGASSRRTVLGGIGAVIAAASAGVGWGLDPRAARAAGFENGSAVPGTMGAAPGATPQLNGGLPPRPSPSNDVNLQWGPCTIVRNGPTEQRSFSSSTTADGRTVALMMAMSADRAAKTSTIQIKIDGQVAFLLTRRQTRTGRTLSAATSHTTAGPAFGVDSLELDSDGTTLTGTINGRAIVPFDLSSGGGFGAIKFADGRPAPQGSVDPAVRDAVEQAFKKAAQDARLCVPPPEYHPDYIKGEGKAVYESPADAGFSKDCQNCYNDCYTSFNSCEAYAAVGCADSGPFYPICIEVALNSCGDSQSGCEDSCAYGSVCCPLKCDNAPPSNGPGLCCEAGQICVDPTNGYCCPDGYTRACAGGVQSDCVCCPNTQATCNGTCCDTGQACSQEGICCKQYEFNKRPVSCRGTCCGGGQTCAAGFCCDEKSVCGGQCCDGECKDGKCCVGSWCGDKCCGYGCDGDKCKPNPLCLGGQWIKGSCCQDQNVCGKVCCPSDQTCLDATTGSCGNLKCSSGQTACKSEMTGGTYTSVCCDGKSPVCCNGQCCGSGQVCCMTNAGVLGCVKPSDCQVIK
jgi:hypothetical protein